MAEIKAVSGHEQADGEKRQMKTKFMRKFVAAAKKHRAAKYALIVMLFFFIFFEHLNKAIADTFKKLTKSFVGSWKMSRRFRYALTAAAAIVIVSAAFGIYAYATAPRAQIVGFADRATGGLRIGEVCEVETSGFPEGATLTYTYTYSRNKKKSPVYGELMIFSSYSNTGSTWITVEDGVPYSRKNYKYFAITGIKPYSNVVNVTVTDDQGHSASCSYSGFLKTDLKADLEAGTYGLFVGEEDRLCNLFEEGGVAWADILDYSVPDFSLVQGSTENISYEKTHIYQKLPWPLTDIDHYDYNLTGLKRGVVCIYSKSNAGITEFHLKQTAYAYTYIEIFSKPTVSETLHTITLTGDTMSGVIYTLNGERIACNSDGEKLVFGTKVPLTPGTDYELVLTQQINGKDVNKTMVVVTSNTCYVHFNTEGKGTSPQNLNNYDGIVNYNTNLSKYTNFSSPSTTGYDFKGWYDNPSYTGSNYLDTPITQENVNMYAKWVPKTYTVKASVKLDGNAYAGAALTLCQKGKAQYTLIDTTASGGAEIYTLSNVAYSEYGDQNGKNYSYDIYINGRDSGLKCFLDGDASSGTEQDITMYCSTIYVNLNKDGSAWSGQKVVIDNNTAQYQMDDSNGKYTYLQAYDTAAPANVHSFVVFVNDVLIRDWKDSSMSEKESTEIPVSRADQANGTNVDFYSVSVTLKKNDSAWTGTDVTLLQNGTVMETPVGAGDGTYNTCVFSKYPYDLYVAGVYTGEDTGIDVNSSNKSPVVSFYSVDFIDGENTINQYYEQIIQNTGKNGRAGKPVAPYKEGKTFMGWFDAKDDGNQYFVGANTTDIIKAKTIIYAHWLTPSLIIGDYVKCNASGVQDGSTSAQYYRLSNLAITGYPKAAGDTPMRTAVVYIDKEDTLYILNNTVVAAGSSGSGTYTYNGNAVSYTYKYTQGTYNEFEFFLNNGDGWTVDQTQSFLNSQLIVKPNSSSNVAIHHCRVRVFGTTATKN